MSPSDVRPLLQRFCSSPEGSPVTIIVPEASYGSPLIPGLFLLRRIRFSVRIHGFACSGALRPPTVCVKVPHIYLRTFVHLCYFHDTISSSCSQTSATSPPDPCLLFITHLQSTTVLITIAFFPVLHIHFCICQRSFHSPRPCNMHIKSTNQRTSHLIRLAGQRSTLSSVLGIDGYLFLEFMFLWFLASTDSLNYLELCSQSEFSM